MKQIIVALAVAAGLSGCAMTSSKTNGFFYTDSMHGEAATSNEAGRLKGKACQSSILGIVSMGDASVNAARKDGKISKITSVDAHTTGILGLYAEYCTIVRGN